MEMDERDDSNSTKPEKGVISYPGLPRPDFILQPWRKVEKKNSPIFFHGCERKSGRGRPGYEVKKGAVLWRPFWSGYCFLSRKESGCLELKSELQWQWT